MIADETLFPDHNLPIKENRIIAHNNWFMPLEIVKPQMMRFFFSPEMQSL